MEQDDKIFDFIKEKIQEPINQVDDKLWSKVETNYEKKSFFRWSLHKMNIYYTIGILTSLIISSSIGVDYISNTQKNITNLQNQLSNIASKNEEQASQINRLEKEVDLINQKLTSSPIIASAIDKTQPRPKKLSGTPIDKNQKNITFNSRQIDTEDQNEVNSTNLIAQEIDEITEVKKVIGDTVFTTKTTKLKPIIITRHDTIVKIDSVKMSKKEWRKLQH